MAPRYPSRVELAAPPTGPRPLATPPAGSRRGQAASRPGAGSSQADSLPLLTQAGTDSDSVSERRIRAILVSGPVALTAISSSTFQPGHPGATAAVATHGPGPQAARPARVPVCGSGAISFKLRGTIRVICSPTVGHWANTSRPWRPAHPTGHSLAVVPAFAGFRI